MDLGCGGGAPAGLAAAACGAREVTLSDLPLVRPLVEANMAANLGVAPNCHFAAYEWPQGSAGERSREDQYPPHGAPFDVVLCADCMYDTKVSPSGEEMSCKGGGPTVASKSSSLLNLPRP